ncbi:hypothetical protein ACYULU_08010 [Breznakiellaceae bacterium SP9]
MIFYALDTNIISYFLKNDPVIVQKVNKEKNKHNKFVVPPMVSGAEQINRAVSRVNKISTLNKDTIDG